MKRKILGIGLVLSTLLLAVGLIGCPTSPDDDPPPAPLPPRTPNSGASLNWVTIGTIERAAPLGYGANVAAVLATAYDDKADEIKLTTAQKSAAITYGLPTQSLYATVEFARVTDAELATVNPDDVEDALSDTTAAGTYTFEDLDYLVVKVTSEDGTNTRYYRFNITLGRNAYLASLTIGNHAQNEKISLGEPATSFGEIEFGTFQTDPIIATSKFIPVPQDEGATVSYFLENLNPGDEPTGLPVSFVPLSDPEGVLVNTLVTLSDNTWVYIKVVPTSTHPDAVTLYYVMRLVIPKAGSILYGVPRLVDPSNPGNPFYIDPIWNTVPWAFEIDRANQAELDNFFRKDYGQHTSAKAKALWDDNGIWVLVDVDVKRFSKTQGGPLEDRPITVTGQEHEADSLEIFINERLQILGSAISAANGNPSTDDIGNQWRVGVNNARSGETAVAITNNGGDGKPLMTPFRDATYAKTRAVLKNSSGAYVGNLEDATNGGYQIIAYAPFKLKSSPNANAVFDAQSETASVKTGALIGFELQLNCNSGEGRDGILTWNGVTTMAYQNAAGYGIVELDRNSKPVDTTVFPEITAQALSNAEYLIGETNVADLSVTTTGNIQWFSSPTLFGAGTPIGGATNSTYKPSAAAAGTTYYYAVVSSGGVSVVTNRRAQIVVGDASMFLEKWTINNPKLTKGWTTPDANGAVYIGTGGGTLFGYTFPVGDFQSVEITVAGTTAGDSNHAAGDPLKFISKQFGTTGPASDNDCLTNRYVDIPVPSANSADFTYTFSVAYPIGAGSGVHANVYNGGIAWQTNTNTVKVDNFRITKAVFTVKTDDDPTSLWATEGAIYVNLAAARSGNNDGVSSNAWIGVYADSTLNADGSITLDYELPAGGTGNPGTRQVSILNFTNQQIAKLETKDKWGVVIEVVEATAPSSGSYRYGFYKAGVWNVSSLSADTAMAVGTLETTHTRNNDNTDPEGFIIQLYNTTPPATSSVTIKSIKITPVED